MEFLCVVSKKHCTKQGSPPACVPFTQGRRKCCCVCSDLHRFCTAEYQFNSGILGTQYNDPEVLVWFCCCQELEEWTLYLTPCSLKLFKFAVLITVAATHSPLCLFCFQAKALYADS